MATTLVDEQIPAGDRTSIRRISVIAPMYNEAAFIEDVVADVARQDFRGEIELIVADGGSTDGSVELLQAAAAVHGLDLVLVDNPQRAVSPGLNACLDRGDGDLVVRLDCHARYPANYLRLCALAAEESGAWNVGGIVTPRGRTRTERAVSCAMSSAFGGIGWTRHGSGTDRVEVDTVTYGAFRPEAFERAGRFDTALVRNQDDELNLRLRLAGGTIVLDPSIRVEYTPRGSIAAVFRQYFDYGFWKIAVMRKHRRVLSLRSLAPLVFVTTILTLAIAAVFSGTARLLLASEAVVYAAAALGAAWAAVRAQREPASLAPKVAAAFPAFHLGYGLGMLSGLVRRARV